MDLASEKQNSKDFPELVKGITKQQEFCNDIRKDFPEQLVLLSFDHQKDIQGLISLLATYPKNSSIAQDIAKYYDDSQKLNSVNAVRLQQYVDNQMPIDSVARNLFSRNRDIVVDQAKMQMKYLESTGLAHRNDVVYNNKMDLLHSIANDKTYGVYASDYVKTELEVHRKTIAYKQEATKQQENQIANEPVVAKSYGFELD